MSTDPQFWAGLGTRNPETAEKRGTNGRPRAPCAPVQLAPTCPCGPVPIDLLVFSLSNRCGPLLLDPGLWGTGGGPSDQEQWYIVSFLFCFYCCANQNTPPPGRGHVASLAQKRLVVSCSFFFADDGSGVKNGKEIGTRWPATRTQHRERAAKGENSTCAPQRETQPKKKNLYSCC